MTTKILVSLHHNFAVSAVAFSIKVIKQQQMNTYNLLISLFTCNH